MSSPDSFAKINDGITPSSFSTTEWMQDIELLVPLYQRLFVWEEEQISQLIDDLKQAYQLNPERPYYIGTLTVYRDPKKQSTWVLVDGQQRITVLTLLGLACSHKWQDNARWNAFLVRGDGSRLRYFARQSDQRDLATLRDKFNADSIINTNMKCFIDVFQRLACDVPTDFSKLVYENTTALVSFLPDTYNLNDLNLYFEKSNAAGRQLEAHEIVKARYFGNYSVKWNAIAKCDKQYTSEKEYERADVVLTLKGLLENGGDLSEKDKLEPSTATVICDSSRLVVSFPIYLLHCLRICSGETVTKSIIGFWESRHLLSTFRAADSLWKSSVHDRNFSDAFIDAMETYRKWMDRRIIHIENDFPVPPYQDSQCGMDCPYDKALWQFQSMLYVSGGEKQAWVLDAYVRSQESSSREPSDDDVLKMLKCQDAERHPFNFSDGAIEEFTYPGINRYWFWKLDYILWEKRDDLRLDATQKRAVDEFTFHRHQSIEHLYPQNPPKPDIRWEKDLHSFGNLAMISASFNSQQSNAGVNTKFGRLKDKMAAKELESIKLLLMFKDAEEDHQKWTPETAGSHRIKMIQFLKNYYAAIPQP